jgi:hypothetical protein
LLKRLLRSDAFGTRGTIGVTIGWDGIRVETNKVLLQAFEVEVELEHCYQCCLEPEDSATLSDEI